MEDKICTKLESLGKYLSFIDYLLELDRNKYTKFNNIKQWIKTKKRYPLDVLEKIEQSITTQYRNLFLMNDVKPPKDIMAIFNNTSAEIRCISVNLCSDDENDMISKDGASEIDDDIEFISVTRHEKKSTETDKPSVVEGKEIKVKSHNTATIDCKSSHIPCKSSFTASNKPIVTDDRETVDLLTKIERIVFNIDAKVNGDGSSHSWRDISDDFDMNEANHNANIFEGEQPFKRRSDFMDPNGPKKKKKSKKSHKSRENKERTGVKKHHKKKLLKINPCVIGETIFIDSSDEDDIGNPKEISVIETSNTKKENTNIVACFTLEHAVERIQNDPKHSIVKSTSTATSKTDRINSSNGSTTTALALNVSSMNMPTLPEACSIPLESMNIEELNQMFQNLSKHNSVEIERCLKTLLSNVCSVKNVNETPAATMVAREPITATNHLTDPVSINIQETNQSTHMLQTSQYFPIDNNFPNMEAMFTPTLHSLPTLPHTNYHNIRKLNLKDPRIIKQLHMIQNSPLYSGGARAAAANVTNWLPNWSVQAQCVPNMMTNAPPQNRITYGDYKRKKAKQALEVERRKVEQQIEDHNKKINELEAEAKQKYIIKLDAERQEKAETETETEIRRNGIENHNKKINKLEAEAKQNNILKLDAERQEKAETETETEIRRNGIEDHNKKINKLEAEAKQNNILKLDAERQEKDETETEIRRNGIQDHNKKINKLKADAKQNKSLQLDAERQEKAETETKIRRNGIEDHNKKINKLEAEAKQNNILKLDAERQEKAETETETEIRRNGIEDHNKKINKLEAEAKQNNILKLDAERQNKAEVETKNLEKIELQKQSDDIRKILLNTLKPYSDKIKNVIHKQSSSTSPEKSNEHNFEKYDEKEPTIDTKKVGDKVDKALKELECTVKGFNNIQDYLPIGGKRRSSVCARTAITEQLNAFNNALYSSTEDLHIEQPNTPKRRKTIDDQLQSKEDSTASSDTDIFEFNISGRYRRKLKDLQQNLPILKLHRLTEAEIAKHMDTSITRIGNPTYDSKAVEQSLLNIELVENKSKTLNERLLTTKAVAAKQLPPKRRNLDEYMTERNAIFCMLCKSKPTDLTNHYIRVHKTESYVARLTAQELEELQLNIPFAVALGGTSVGANTNTRICKYKVTCPFCSVELVDSFLNFYTHYSSHTGEYAYQCNSCKLQKPYRADIQSHQLHTKSCRNSRIQQLYQYPPNLMVIYLHCCEICNFVQLNEANVYKHLREHHCQRQEDASCVKKYILAAICTGNEEATSVREQQSPVSEDLSSLGLLKNDDGVSVHNEPILDDSFVEQKPQVEDMLKDLFNGDCDGREFIDEHLQPISKMQNPIQNTGKNVTDYRGNAVDFNGPFSPMTIIHAVLPTDNSSTQLRLSNTLHSDNDNTNMNLQPHRPIQLPDFDVKPDINELESQINNNSSLPVAAPAIISEQQQQMTHTSTVATVVEQCKSAKIITSDQPTNNVVVPQRSVRRPQYAPHQCYKSYCPETSYFGLYKCLAADCFFSSDSTLEMIHHLQQHNESECPPAAVLNCAYCQLDAEVEHLSTPQSLVAHISRRHGYSHFQCNKCCYRSCVPGNVVIHRQKMHQDANAIEDYVYKCYGRFISINERLPYIIKKMSEHVPAIACPHCTTSYYSISSLEKHLHTDHSITDHNLPYKHNHYACIYCSESSAEKKEMQEHHALKHPDELAYVCERVLRRGVQVDNVLNLQLTNVALTVLPKYIKNIPRISRDCTIVDIQAKAKAISVRNSTPATMCENVQNDVSNDKATIMPACHAVAVTSQIPNLNPIADHSYAEDIKPDIEKLVALNAEMVKPLLLKLTRDSGVPPDRLYPCPKSDCGGFFFTYNLWRRHMTQRHSCVLVACPHCPDADVELQLEDFEQHFEQHCRHLYVCFHCGETHANELQLRAHCAVLHSELSATMRLEKITFNISYSYFVLVAAQLHTERLQFLLELQQMLKTQLAHLEKVKAQQMLTEWNVPAGSDWLEDLPVFSINKGSEKKCIQPDCPFRTRQDLALFEHLRQKHAIYGHQFKCSKCGIMIKECHNWDAIIEHVKMHSSDLHICCVCFYYHYDRRQVSQHIQQSHDARDVPVLTLLRYKDLQQDYKNKMAISVVFAASKITFSTLSSCFCCPKLKLGMENYGLHLKHTHRLKLRYACELCDEPLPQLQKIVAHFSDKHSAEQLPKLRCELATNEQLCVASVMPFRLFIGAGGSKRNCSHMEAASEQAKRAKAIDNAVGVTIKEEEPENNSDDEVTVLEDDDLVVAAALSTACGHKPLPPAAEQVTKAAPKIRCISIESLLKTQAAVAANLCTTPPPALVSTTAEDNTPPQNASAGTVRVFLSPDQYAKLNGADSGQVDANAKPKQITLRRLLPKTTIMPTSSLSQTCLNTNRSTAPQQSQQATQQQQQPQEQQQREATTAEQFQKGLPIPVIECGNVQIKPNQIGSNQNEQTISSTHTFNRTPALNRTTYNIPGSIQYQRQAPHHQHNQNLPAMRISPILQHYLAKPIQTNSSGNPPVPITISHIDGGKQASQSPKLSNSITNANGFFNRYPTVP